MTYFLRYIITALIISTSVTYAQMPPAKIELVKINDDIYVLSNPFVPGNATVIITDEGLVLIDNKFSVDWDNMLKLIKTVSDKEIVYAINTHYHGDHTGNNIRLQEIHASVFASMHARRRMVETNQPGLPDITVKEEAEIHIGGKTIELHFMGRAHTGGDIIVLIKEDRVLATGDVFTNGANVPPLIDYAGGGSIRDWSVTLNNILSLDFETVIPGHGPVGPRSLISKARENIITIRTEVSKILADNKTRADVEKYMREKYNWIDLHVDRGLDGLIAELR